MRKNKSWQQASALLVVVMGVGTASAQWTSDPSVNTVVANGGGDQTVPLVRPTPDGGVWIFFFDSAGGTGLKPTIQRLTASGQRVFAGNGVALANRHNTASFTNDITVDASGNAIVAFDDDSSGSTMITVQKVALDGSLPWGAAGVQMPGSAGFLGPRVAACQNGTIVACWSTGQGIAFQRLTSSGSPVPNGTWSITETGHALSPSGMVSGGNAGDVILMWVRAEGTNVVTSRKGLKIQKWDTAGQAVWSGSGGTGTPIDVYTSSAAPSRGIQIGYFPALLSDGAGGAITTWYDTAADRNAWLQHVLGDGTQRFPQNGLAMSTTTSATEYRAVPSVAYDAAQNEYVVAYERSNPLQSLFGLGAQRVQADGTRLWGGGAGLDLLPVASNHKSFINVADAPGHAAVLSWLEYQGANGPMVVDAMKLDSAGASVWAGGILGVSTSAVDKGRLAMSHVAGSDMLVCAWQDSGAGSVDVLAQNINMDGTLGDNTPHCPADLDDDGNFANGGHPDGGVTIEDLLYFLAGFEIGDVAVDLDNGTGTGTRDGAVTIDDLLFYLVRFEGGC